MLVLGSMSGMTGEAMPAERRPGISSPKETALNHENICLMVRLSSVLMMPAEHNMCWAWRQNHLQSVLPWG